MHLSPVAIAGLKRENVKSSDKIKFKLVKKHLCGQKTFFLS
jgi:hypothetical protein